LKATQPSFKPKSELARYIRPTERNGKNHAASSAFQMDGDDLDADEPHLSVNALECQPIDGLADYLRTRFQGGEGDVAICVHKVHTYVDNGKKAGAAVRAAMSHGYLTTVASRCPLLNIDRFAPETAFHRVNRIAE
jgi:hypothetical protein